MEINYSEKKMVSQKSLKHSKNNIHKISPSHVEWNPISSNKNNKTKTKNKIIIIITIENNYRNNKIIIMMIIILIK